ncbi:MAG TPA: hypothetical protein VG245_06305 [Candidatus Dormibacteraeota bacterium]|nr:hypothetical protein [Candidatus Dormibacteraeota bacterium]
MTLAAVAAMLAGCSLPGGAAAPAGEHLTLALRAAPWGGAELRLGGGGMSVRVALTGLSPRTTHPAEILAGACDSLGAAVHGLGDLAADDTGSGALTAAVGGVTAVPATGWAVVVHSGPSLDTPAGFHPLACGEVRAAPPAATPSPDAIAILVPPAAVSGSVDLGLEARTLTVQATVHGLTPGTAHPFDIRAGTCAAPGAVVYRLPDLGANAAGTASATGTISDVGAIQYGGWHVAIHQGPGVDDAAGLAPIACADVGGADHPAPTPSPETSPGPSASPQSGPMP